MKLGNPNGARALRGKQTGNTEAVAAIKAKADDRASNLRSIIADLRAQGINSVRMIAQELNSRAVLTPRGGASGILRQWRGCWSVLRQLRAS